MKRDQVPQDDANLMDGHREVVYAVDENGKYVKALSPGWDPKNTALKQAWEQIDEKVREACRLVEQGKASPLAVFMARNIFDIKLLSDYTGIPKRKIKAHLEPEAFKTLDGETLKKYADAFNVEPAELAAWRTNICHSERSEESFCSDSLEKRDSSAAPQNDIATQSRDGYKNSAEVKK